MACLGAALSCPYCCELLHPGLIEEHAVEGVELHVAGTGGGHDDVPTRGEGDDGRALRDLALDPVPGRAPLGTGGLHPIDRRVDLRVAEPGQVAESGESAIQPFSPT